MVTVDRHERLITRMLPALGADAGEYNAASVRRVILDQIRGCRPAHAKTIVGALRVYLRFLATSGACQPGLDHALPTVAEWKLSSLPRYLDAQQVPASLTPVAKTGRRDGGTVRSYCCCFGLGSERATLPACAPLISIGRRPRCWCEARDAGMSVCLCHRMQETRFWTTLNMRARRLPLTECFSAQMLHSAPSDLESPFPTSFALHSGALASRIHQPTVRISFGTARQP